ncbi:MAG: hypothetical protein ABI426_01305 [Flavobacterium sp.]
MKKIIILVFILSTIVFSSCKNDEKALEPEVKTQNAEPVVSENKSENKIATDKLTTLYSETNQDGAETVKISAYKSSDNDKFFLGGDKAFIIASKYKKKGNSLKLVQQDTLISSEFSYVNIDSKSLVKKKVGNTDYLMLSIFVTPQGNAEIERYVTFIMLDINSFKFYALGYTGVDSIRCDECIDGEFQKNKDLESNPEIQKELYQFAYKSKWVYNPTEEEKDPNYYKNYEQKWIADNNSDNRLASGSSSLPDVIYSTYYKDNIIRFTGEYSEDEVIENSDYKIVTFFRGNILGYDKKKQLYFPIFIESCVIGCNKTIEFLSKNTIEIVNSEDSGEKAKTINLEEIKFKN